MEQIKENILRGKLRVGDKLPSERELSTQLGVSRSSVREALRSLDILGVVVSIQGEGTYIQGDFQDSLCMLDRKSTRLNSSHANISYAVFCLKKKKTKYEHNIYCI